MITDLLELLTGGRQKDTTTTSMNLLELYVDHRFHSPMGGIKEVLCLEIVLFIDVFSTIVDLIIHKTVNRVCWAPLRM